MSTLGELHASFWMSPRFESDLSWVVPVDQRPGWALLLYSFRRNRRSLPQRDDLRLTPAVHRMCAYVNENEKRLFSRWDSGPLTLIHGDCHFGNTDLRRKHERDLIALYLQTLAQYGVKHPPAFEQAWDDYRFFAFEAWDSITFGIALPGMQTAKDCMAGFTRANAAIEDLEVDVAIRRWVDARHAPKALLRVLE